ncbi:uncharacterized protein LOC119736756 [Patiria miniata]|uniref:Ig-like domain-containing protein n=1 Tax=Patiria miniata TaxID=46514 RepID=A0A914AT88_PATMI|nr:uncharacterized protein LOC119736756 [Patiria miniata]
MYWYYGSISSTSLLISYFFGSVAPQNGIPEGVYDIDDEFSLVIENVTASNEGTYYFQLKPHLKMIEEGQVEVCGEGACIQANTDGIVFLERGHRGIIPCPLVKYRQIPPGDVDVMNWHYGSISKTSMLIRNSFGRVTSQNGIPEGVYDIDNEFNLVIENVTASNQGTYYFQLKPRLNRQVEAGQVEVCDKVSPGRPYPTVIGCNQDHDADTCEVRVQHGSTVYNLTCAMEQVKPAVQLRWIRLFLGGKTELNASTTVRPVVLPAYTGSLLRNNTYSTSALVQLAAVDDEEVYECEAVGVAVGGSTRTRVRLTKTHPTTATHDTTYNEVQSSNNPGGLVQANTDGTVFLERGQRGIVPCPLVISRQISPGDVDAMFWYYGSTRDTSLLISYFLGRVAPQNGIPEGVYDIDNEFSLVIENVTAFNEGTYYFQVKPRLKMLDEGKVTVRDKVYPSRPYPTVIGCNQDHDADTCEVRVRHDSTVHNLTCVMEQVKPAMELRWIRLFLGGQTELNVSTMVWPVVLPTYTGSSMRNNTYSTLASVQVTTADDEEVYECEAVGVAVGDITRTRVRLTKTHPTTATHPKTATHDATVTYGTTTTYNEAQSSNNPDKFKDETQERRVRIEDEGCGLGQISGV